MAVFGAIIGVKRAIRLKNKQLRETTSVLLHFVYTVMSEGIPFSAIIYPVKAL